MSKLVVKTPTANIAVNKSRLKMYDKNSNTPTFYLQKGQEFQLEFFNPTTDTILAKIFLNNKTISQGGLVLRPGQRVFLDRYLDVEKKFKFDTYDVANTDEVKEAIKDNGDFKVEFYREETPIPVRFIPFNTNNYPPYTPPFNSNNYYDSSVGPVYGGPLIGQQAHNLNLTSINIDPNNTSGTVSSLGTKSLSNKVRSKKSKSIETGRVEQGSTSSQKIKSVSLKFEHLPFHILRYKLLPTSQKVNTVQDIKTRYCTECGAKAGKTDKFCRQCGNKH